MILLLCRKNWKNVVKKLKDFTSIPLPIITLKQGHARFLNLSMQKLCSTDFREFWYVKKDVFITCILFKLQSTYSQLDARSIQTWINSINSSLMKPKWKNFLTLSFTTSSFQIPTTTVTCIRGHTLLDEILTYYMIFKIK